MIRVSGAGPGHKLEEMNTVDWQRSLGCRKCNVCTCVRIGQKHGTNTLTRGDGEFVSRKTEGRKIYP